MRRGLGSIAIALLAACKGGGEGSDEDAGSTTSMEMEPLEIIGLWDDNISGEHTIEEDRWIQAFDPNVYTYFISYYDNDLEFMVARLANDTMTYSRLEWAYVGEQLYYCESVKLEVSAIAAETGGEADRTSPATGGCVGMPWVPLTPRQ
jgi:hypothetical protein